MLSTELIPIRKEAKTPHQSHNVLTPRESRMGRSRDQPILVSSKIPIHDLKPSKWASVVLRVLLFVLGGRRLGLLPLQFGFLPSRLAGFQFGAGGLVEIVQIHVHTQTTRDAGRQSPLVLVTQI